MVFCIGTGAHNRSLRYTEKIPGYSSFSYSVCKLLSLKIFQFLLSYLFILTQGLSLVGLELLKYSCWKTGIKYI